MVNALVISKNIDFIQALLSEIGALNLQIRIAGISTTRSKTMEVLNSPNFKLIFLDKVMEGDYSKAFIKNHKNVIILSYKQDSNLISPRNFKSLKELVEKYDLEKRKSKVAKELEYIGYKFKYKGTHYLLESILQMIENKNTMVDNLQTCVYPIVAEKYSKTTLNIKSSINKATECMYYECDAKRLENYFKCGQDVKPTVKQVIFTIINKI